MAEQVNDPTNVQGDGEQLDTGLGEGRTFTQDQLNAIVSDRLARERGKFADYDDLKAQSAKLKEIEDAQKTELQRAQEAQQAAEERAKVASAHAQERLMQAEFLSAAALAGVAHPEDAYALADKTAVQMGDDGKITGVIEAVKSLVDAGRLVMSGRPRAANLDGGAGSGDRASDKALQATPAQEKAAKNMNIPIEEYMKYVSKE